MQILLNSPFPPGLIGFCAGDLPRFKQFEKSARHLIAPEGSRDCDIEGMSIAAGRNEAIRRFMSPDHKWVWFVDDDNPIHPELLIWLLQRDVDVIQPMVVNRKPPYVPHAHRWNNGKLDTIPWEELPLTGILECDGVGAGGMLIKREVLDALGDPWFKCGQQDPEHIQEDTTFCIEAQQLGFKIWVDLDHAIGHCHTHTLWPQVVEGKWRVIHDLGGGKTFTVPVGAPVDK